MAQRGRPPLNREPNTEVVAENTEMKQDNTEPLTVAVEIPIESEQFESKKKKTVVEWIGEFENKGVLEVPKYVKEKYPGGHFLWVWNDDKRINEKLGMGYTLVRVSERAKERLGTAGYTNTADELVKHGDAVLMVIPVEAYEAMRIIVEKRLQSKLRGMKKGAHLAPSAREIANGIGQDVPVFADFKQVRG